MESVGRSRGPTWTADVLKVTQAGLLGQAVDELAGLAVLVAGRQLQRGQLLHRVLVQHQTLVDHHAGRKVVLWKEQQRGSEHQRGGGLKYSTTEENAIQERVHQSWSG